MIWIWLVYITFILLMLALDLGVFHKQDHVVKTKEALTWTMVWVTLALLFSIFVYYFYESHPVTTPPTDMEPFNGKHAAIQYITGYLIEKSLSLDNIFVIALIFAYFKIPQVYQHRVLFWGILGALLLRGLMIAAGTALIQRFSWMIYIFGGFLIFTALRMLFTAEEGPDLEHNRLVKWTRRIYPVSERLEGHNFFTRVNGRRAITPLFLVLLLVETSDVIFALDSIPAIFAVTREPYIVFTSNIFAILGLRSLYFVLAHLLDQFDYFKYSLVAILGYVGVKMVISNQIHIPSWISLCVIGGALALGVLASVLKKRAKR